MIVGVKMFVYIWSLVAVHGVLVIGVLGSEKALSDASDAYVKGVYARFLEDLINTNEDKIKALKKLSHTKHNVKNYYRDDESIPQLDHLYRSQIGMLMVVPQNNPNGRFKSDPLSTGDLEFILNKKYYNSPHFLQLRDSVEISSEEETSGVSDVYKELDERSIMQTDSLKTESQENDGAIENENDNEPNYSDEGQKHEKFLRKKWRSSCDKKAARYCRKACKSAFKSACADFDCSKKLKNSLNINCNSKCKSTFLSQEL